jgi:short subunit dehydrogenase-like uncharacterized protein
MNIPDLIARLRERAERLRKQNESCQRVVDLLQPEMDKFDARTGHDIYTVRMSVDHASNLRTQAKELADLLEAAILIEALITREAVLTGALGPFADYADTFNEACEQHPGGCPDAALVGEVVDLRVGDFRRARTALTDGGKEQ